MNLIANSILGAGAWSSRKSTGPYNFYTVSVTPSILATSICYRKSVAFEGLL